MCGVKGRSVIVLFKQKFNSLVYENVWPTQSAQNERDNHALVCNFAKYSPI